MACFGSKALQRKAFQPNRLVQTTEMAGEEENNSSKQGGRKKNRRPHKGHPSPAKRGTAEKKSRIPRENDAKAKENFTKKHHLVPVPQPCTLRKKVDPETAKYFSEIANLFDSKSVDLDEQSIVCGNALEETRGKELELATDMIISHTLQTLLEGCDLDQLCSFLRGCSKEFSSIAMDKFGSHVAETALKSLAVHLQDQDAYSVIEETLTKICQVVVVDPVSVMCSRYGSHVLRSLLCLCKGMPLDSMENFHVTKPSAVLAERLNVKSTEPGGNKQPHLQQGFPDILKFLIVEMLKNARNEITALRFNNYSSLVLQTSLKLLVRDDPDLLYVILVLLGCPKENDSQGTFIETSKVQDIMGLLEDTASSHLLEVILEVIPDNLYDELLLKVFRCSLFEISSHHCGNFVVQALISSARSQGQVNLIWEELGPKIKNLLEIGKSGVVASLLAACQRLQTHGHECCQALVTAVRSDSEPPSCIVPHILFLESYFSCNEKSSWKWPTGVRMHTLGCLMLQTVFGYSNQFIQPFIKSILSMETDNVLETAKDAGGGRVLESFLCSDVYTKQKLKVIASIREHFGELSMHSSGSFIVEKCFNASNLLLKEAIASELLHVRSELSKTKHGPYILKKLDIDGFASRPEQWKSSRASREAAHREFHAAFGSNNTSPLEGNKLAPQHLSHASPKKQSKRHKTCEVTDHCIDSEASLGSGLENSMAKLGFPGLKHGFKRERSATAAAEGHNRKRLLGNSNANTCFARQQYGERKSLASELAELAGKGTLSSSDVRKLFEPTVKEKRQQSAPVGATPFVKKQKR